MFNGAVEGTVQLEMPRRTSTPNSMRRQLEVRQAEERCSGPIALIEVRGHLAVEPHLTSRLDLQQNLYEIGKNVLLAKRSRASNKEITIYMKKSL